MTERKPPARKRVFIVDPHPVMRQGLTQLISGERDLIVCGEADTAGQALNLISARPPNLVLADVSLPDRNGLELIRDIRVFHPDVPVLVFSSCEEAMFAERVLRAGGKGYLMKSEPAAKLLEAIRRVLSGKLFVSENVSARVLESFVGLERVSRHPLQQLSEREFEVLQHVGQGRSSRAIAELLRISPKTVEVHRSHIKRKLQLKSGAALMRFALRSIPGGPE